MFTALKPALQEIADVATKSWISVPAGSRASSESGGEEWVQEDWAYPNNVPRGKSRNSEACAVRCYESGRAEVVAERSLSAPTLGESRNPEPEAQQAIYGELRRWAEVGGPKRHPRSRSRNIVLAEVGCRGLSRTSPCP